MSRDNGTVEIDDKFLGQGDLFGLRYSDGFVFFEVSGVQMVQYKPYSAGSVAANDNSGWQRLEDSGDDILYIEKQNNKVLHGAIGIAPGDMRMYSNYPESENRQGKFPNLSTPTPGDDYGYIDGTASPYNGPTDAREFWIPPGTHLDFSFSNPDNNDHNAVLNLKFASYSVRPLKIADHQNQISRIVSPGSPMPVAPVGTPDYQDNFTGRNTFGNVLVKDSKINQLRR